MSQLNDKIFNQFGVQYLTDKQVAEITNKSVQTLRNERWKRQGIPWIKFGGAIRYDLQDVILHMNERKVSTDSYK
jgi:hypothetical protein